MNWQQKHGKQINSDNDVQAERREKKLVAFSLLTRNKNPRTHKKTRKGSKPKIMSFRQVDNFVHLKCNKVRMIFPLDYTVSNSLKWQVIQSCLPDETMSTRHPQAFVFPFWQFPPLMQTFSSSMICIQISQKGWSHTMESSRIWNTFPHTKKGKAYTIPHYKIKTRDNGKTLHSYNRTLIVCFVLARTYFTTLNEDNSCGEGRKVEHQKEEKQGANETLWLQATHRPDKFADGCWLKDEVEVVADMKDAE